LGYQNDTAYFSDKIVTVKMRKKRRCEIIHTQLGATYSDLGTKW
jgi:hypothetical protein